MYYWSGTVAHTSSQWRHTRSVSYRAAGRRHGRHRERMTSSCQKSPTPSIDAYLLEEQILPNFIPIWFETTEPWAFFEEVAPTRRRTRWVAIWSQILIQQCSTKHQTVFYCDLRQGTSTEDCRRQNGLHYTWNAKKRPTKQCTNDSLT